jgi:SAM-dependent methyltransferase
VSSTAERLEAFVAQHGPWKTHNVFLGDGTWTLSGSTPAPDLRLRRCLQVVADLAGRPLGELRVLDLACGEGLFGIELARRGAAVLGIEGRDVHVARARFAAEVLGLERYDVVQGDIRDLSREEHGEFDVVLCLGVLYHLDAPAVFELLRAVAEVCTRLAIVDTWVGAAPEAERHWDGRGYWGAVVPEHAPEQTPEERLAALQSSLDNPDSFWLTRPSLLNALLDVGFTSVFEALAPRRTELPMDEVVLAAVRGDEMDIAGLDSAVAWPRLPEDERRRRHPTQTARGRARRRLRSLVRGRRAHASSSS